MRKPHAHIYVGIEKELREDWAEYLPPYKEKTSKSVAENNIDRQKHLESWREKAIDLVHVVRVKSLAARMAVVWSEEHNSSWVVPQGDSWQLLSVSQETLPPVVTVAGMFFRWASRILAEHEVPGSNIVFRCEHGIDTRHLLRCEALASGELHQGVCPALYFGTATESISSLLCPASAGDSNVIFERLAVSPLPSSDAVTEAQRSLHRVMSAYSRAGLLVY